MDNDDVWDDEEDHNTVPTSSHDKFEKDLEKLQEIHSNVYPTPADSDGVGRV
jgi:hypothetical protein